MLILLTVILALSTGLLIGHILVKRRLIAEREEVHTLLSQSTNSSTSSQELEDAPDEYDESVGY